MASIDKIRYVHEEYTHELRSPRAIVPLLMSIFNPGSVIDVGCGIGTFLYVFKEHGVANVLGIDGSWTNRALLNKYLNDHEFIEKNLSDDFQLERTFDLALSLEVAEHLPEKDADNFVKNLTTLSKAIIFSAAIPGQGGQNHINEQWPSYWQERFAKYGYIFHDKLRPLIWDNPEIQWWYRQNIFLVMHQSINESGIRFPEREQTQISNYIHPELFRLKEAQLSDLIKGESAASTYIKLILKKLLRPVRKSI